MGCDENQGVLCCAHTQKSHVPRISEIKSLEHTHPGRALLSAGALVLPGPGEEPGFASSHPKCVDKCKSAQTRSAALLKLQSTRELERANVSCS